MSSTTNPKGMQHPTATTTAGGENREAARRRHRIELALWIIGIIIFIIACFFVSVHPRPYSIDLTVTHDVQGANLPSWLLNILNFPSLLNDPTPSYIATGAWFVFMLVMALIFKLRQKSPVQWLQSAVFFLVAIAASAGLNVLLDILIGRPRPSPKLYHMQLHTALVPFPTFPSGHTEHDMVYYGFLLYLSFTKPVREWRYRWVLLPLQIYAIFDILSIGFSRIWEGDHWLTDVLGGYLEGAIFLFFFIFLYRWITQKLEEHREKKIARQVTQVQAR